MKVKDLIEKLQKCDPESIVDVWDPYSDGPIEDVVIEENRVGNRILICNWK